MTRGMWGHIAAGVLLATSLWAGAVQEGGDPEAARIRRAVEARQDTLACVKGSMTVTISFQVPGQEPQHADAEVKVELAACLVDAAKAGVLFAGCDPKTVLDSGAGPLAALMADPANRCEVEVKESRFRAVLLGGKEADVKVEGVDPETGLAFFRAEGIPKEARALPLSTPPSLSVGDPFLLLSLRSPEDPVPTAIPARVAYILKREQPLAGIPRNIEGGALAVGTPAFTPEGGFLGLVAVRKRLRDGVVIDRDYVILPADRLLSLARGVRASAEGAAAGK